MTKTIAVFGAIDRMNYGDLLFPLVLRAAFAKSDPREISFKCYGLRESDLQSYDALPSRPLHEMFDPRTIPDGGAVIVAGGEVLGCEWCDAHYYLRGRFGVAERIVKRVGGGNLLNRFIGRSYGSSARLPFVLTPDLFPNQVKIAYNSVGGSNLASKPELATYVRRAISEASFISVRDIPSHEILSSRISSTPTLPIQIVPDSAILMSHYFPLENLTGKLSMETRRILDQFKSGQYFCLQVKNSLGSKYVTEIKAQIQRIHRELGLPCVLLPIGRAFGHSDQIVLTEIRNELNSSAVTLVEANTLFDTMALIANSAAFAGTSLHGAITAMSYAVPHFALSAKDLKVPAFLDTWDVDLQRVIRRFDEITTGTRAVMGIPRATLRANAKRVLVEAQRGLCEMAKALDLPSPPPLPQAL